MQNPQQLHLRGVRNLANLVEKQRTAGRRLEKTGVVGRCACERTRLVPEQFRIKQGLGEGAAVDSQKGALAARRARVNQTGDHLFSNSAFAGNKHR